MVLLCSPAAASPLRIWSMGGGSGEADVDQRAAAEIDPVAQAVVLQNRRSSRPPAGSGKGDEILRLAHPVDIDAVKKFHSIPIRLYLTPDRLDLFPVGASFAHPLN